MEYQSGAVSPVGCIEEGWSIIKSDYWTFFLMTTVAIIIVVAAALILGTINNVIVFGITAALGGAASDSGDAGNVAATILPELFSVVIGAFINVIVGTLSGALFCGIYTSLSRRASGENADFGDLFSGFQKIKQCLVVAVVLAFIQLIIGTVTLFSGAAVGVSTLGIGTLTKDGTLNPAVFGGLFSIILIFAIAYIIINFLISALTAFVYPLISERNLSGGEALQLSFKSGLANFGGLILLLILLGLMTVVGVFACCVGVLFVAPLISAALFAAYQSVFGKMENSLQHTPPPPPTFGNQQGF